MTSSEPVRFGRVAPADRPRRQRHAVRVILIDDQDRALLFQDSDPWLAGSRWWITPGGGADPGETELDTAIREVVEETGCIITAGQLIGPVARRLVVHGMSDIVTHQTESFYLARVETFKVDISGHTEEERITMQQHRWWTRDELMATTEAIWPARLLQLWASIDQPDSWPMDLGTEEESTVPVTP